MIKVYRCVSEVSFNLKINGNKRRINFDPMSGGKSQYRTGDPDIQKGIEKLEIFGSVIHEVESIEEDADYEEESGQDVVLNDGGGGVIADVLEGVLAEKAGGEADGGGTVKDVQDGIVSFAEAKEYLITKGCDKTIRSKENILAYAQELGVEFPNLK